MENGKTRRLGVIDLPSFYGDVDSSKGKSCTEDVARRPKEARHSPGDVERLVLRPWLDKLEGLQRVLPGVER